MIGGKSPISQRPAKSAQTTLRSCCKDCSEAGLSAQPRAGKLPTSPMTGAEIMHGHGGEVCVEGAVGASTHTSRGPMFFLGELHDQAPI